MDTGHQPAGSNEAAQETKLEQQLRESLALPKFWPVQHHGWWHPVYLSMASLVPESLGEGFVSRAICQLKCDELNEHRDRSEADGPANNTHAG